MTAGPPSPPASAGRPAPVSADVSVRPPSNQISGSRSRPPISAGGRFDQTVFWLYLLALAWVPLYFGSNRLFAWGVNAVLFGGLVVVYELGIVMSGRPHPVTPRRIAVPAGLFVLIVGWILLQTASWTQQSWHNPLWTLAGDALAQAGITLQGAISATPDEGVLGSMRLLTVAAGFWLGLQLCRDARRADLFLGAMAAIGLAYALLGLIQFFVMPDQLLWTRKEAYLGSLTASFVNRNSYATFAGLGLVASLGLLIESYRRASAGHVASLRLRLAAIAEATLRHGVFQLITLFLVLAALLLTGSRAGIVSSLAGALVLVTIVVGMLRRRRLVVALLLPVLLAGALAFMVYGEHFTERLATGGGLEARLAVAGRTLEAARDVPWTGYGYGSFDLVFSLYRDADMGPINQHWDKAHNTYVELIFELGFPAALAFGLMVLWIIAGIVRNTARREHAAMPSLVALGASAVVLLHALLDFSLQMQAVAITYWAMLGAGLAQSWSRRVDTRA